MSNAAEKDYATGRRLMTAEVSTVVEAIFEHGPAEILVNDSHGDMQNLLHTSLDPRVTYIQGNIKPLGMCKDSTGRSMPLGGWPDASPPTTAHRPHDPPSSSDARTIRSSSGNSSSKYSAPRAMAMA